MWRKTDRRIGKESSQTIRILSGDLKSLRAVLKESEKALLVRPPSPDSGARLQEVLAPCRDVLNDSQKLIDKYERPGAKRSKIWIAVNLRNEKIPEIRARLTSSVTMLTAFNVAWKVDSYIAMHPPQRRPRSIDSQCSAGKVAWRQIRKELEANGISWQVFEAHKEFIMRQLSHAIERGALEERYAPDSENELPLETESAPSNGINSATSNASGTILSTELNPVTEHQNLDPEKRQSLLSANGADCEITPTISLQVASLRPTTYTYVALSSLPLPNSWEPDVICRRCGKENMAFELHMRCKDQCSNGQFDICLQCWRLGRGCLNWYGFGRNGWDRYASSRCPETEEPIEETEEPIERTHPHYLFGRRYRRVTIRNAPTDQDGESVLVETSDPSGHLQLQSGYFCSVCATFMPRYLMQCEICNGGEWAYCITCVNRGRCCTHPLLPAALVTNESYRNSMFYATTESANELPLDVHRHSYMYCHSCRTSIGFSENFYHCPDCESGDYDLCQGCYLGLVTSGQISKADGPQGWRRCQEGHRMIVIALEYSARRVRAFEFPVRRVQKRIIVEGLVGGHLSDAGSQYPPNWGLEPPLVALCSFWPSEKERNEEPDLLASPEGAEIQEVWNHNNGWFSGVHCGKKGCFWATWATNAAKYSTASSAPKLPPRHQ